MTPRTAYSALTTFWFIASTVSTWLFDIVTKSVAALDDSGMDKHEPSTSVKTRKMVDKKDRVQYGLQMYLPRYLSRLTARSVVVFEQ